MALLAVPAWAQGGLSVTSDDTPMDHFGPHQFANLGRCRGSDTSPQVQWSGVPAGTQSFMVSLFDVDARGGQGFWHWAMYDIGANVASLDGGAGNTPPAGAKQGRNNYGKPGYGGPCPPSGETHKYRLEVRALDVATLGLPDGAGGAAVAAAAEGHTLASGVLMLTAP